MPLLLMEAVGIALMCRGCNQSTLYARTVIHRPCTSLEVSYVSISKSSITLRCYKNVFMSSIEEHATKIIISFGFRFLFLNIYQNNLHFSYFYTSRKRAKDSFKQAISTEFMQYFFSLIKEKCGFQICFYRKSGFFLALFIGKVYPAGFRTFQ